MALIKCPGCGKNVSENAKRCPKCGEPIKIKKKLEIINKKKDDLKNIIKSDKKRRNIIVLCIVTIIIIVCVVIAFSSSNKVKTDDFKNKLESVASKNEYLSDLTFKKNDSGVDVNVDGEPIGFYFVGKSKYIKMVLGVVSEEATISQYKPMMIAAFLALDKKLTFDEAEEIADKLDDNCFYEKDDKIIKNGIKYSWNCEDTISSGEYGAIEFSSWSMILEED